MIGRVRPGCAVLRVAGPERNWVDAKLKQGKRKSLRYCWVGRSGASVKERK
jgi:hypothetical protein